MSNVDSNIPFREFFATWVAIQDFEINDYHFRIFDFLEDYENWHNQIGVLQAFRNAGKSTIIASFIVWLLTKNPALRIMVQSADDKSARKTIFEVQSIVRRHPGAKHLYDPALKWNENEVYVRGAKYVRDASAAARGINSNVTGSRSDFTLYDDVEMPSNARTQDRRDKLRVGIRESSRLLDPAWIDRQLFIGTPHTYDSIYDEYIQNGCSSLKIPLLRDYEKKVHGEYPNVHGETEWPGKFDDEKLKQLQIGSQNTKAEFRSQYLLEPYTLEDSTLDPSLLKWYREETEYYESNSQPMLMIGKKRMVQVVAFWDPALNTVKGDDSVVSIVYFAEDGSLWLHRAQALTGTNPDKQCEQLKRLLLEHCIPRIHVETNALGAFLPEILKKHMKPVGIRVLEKYTTRNKGEKILGAFEAPLYGGYLHVHESLKRTKFTKQLQAFNPAVSNQADDWIDSPAMAIDGEPVRIARATDPSDPMNYKWGEYSQGVTEYEEHKFKFKR